MTRFLSYVQHFLVPPPLLVPLFALPCRLVADALWVMVKLDYSLLPPPPSALVPRDSDDESPILCPRPLRLLSFTSPPLFDINLPCRLAAVADTLSGMINIDLLFSSSSSTSHPCVRPHPAPQADSRCICLLDMVDQFASYSS